MAAATPRKRRPAKKNPTPFETLGAQLAQARIAAGYTQGQLADILVISVAKLESIEQGRRPLTLDLAEQLDLLLHTSGVLKVGVEHLPDDQGAIAIWALGLVDAEQTAVAISSYQTHVLPGLLQTEAYMRAVFGSRVPLHDPDEITRQVAARLARQEIMQRRVPPSLSFVLSEAPLRDRIGGTEVCRTQIQHLRERADMPGLTLQILPMGVTSHAALDGPFVLMETPHHEHIAYTETQRTSRLIRDPEDVSILAQRYAMLRTQALNTHETKGLLEQLLGEV